MPLALSPPFPATLIQMIAVGERTGRLSSLMNSSATHMETEVDGRLKALISIIEPLMIVFMAVIVGMITASMSDLFVDGEHQVIGWSVEQIV